MLKAEGRDSSVGGWKLALTSDPRPLPSALSRDSCRFVSIRGCRSGGSARVSAPRYAWFRWRGGEKEPGLPSPPIRHSCLFVSIRGCRSGKVGKSENSLTEDRVQYVTAWSRLVTPVSRVETSI